MVAVVISLALLAVPSLAAPWHNYNMLATEREEVARDWAPLVWLHPEERFYPHDVQTFLRHTIPSVAGWGPAMTFQDGPVRVMLPVLPEGHRSRNAHLLAPIHTECTSCPLPRFLYGKKPGLNYSPPVYAVIHSCQDDLSRPIHGRRDLHYLNDQPIPLPSSTIPSPRLKPPPTLQNDEVARSSSLSTSSSLPPPPTSSSSFFSPPASSSSPPPASSSSLSPPPASSSSLSPPPASSSSLSPPPASSSSLSPPPASSSSISPPPAIHPNPNLTNALSDKEAKHGIESQGSTHASLLSDNINTVDENSLSSLTPTQNQSHNSTSGSSAEHFVDPTMRDSVYNAVQSNTSNPSERLHHTLPHLSSENSESLPFHEADALDHHARPRKRQTYEVDQVFTVTYWMFYPYNYGKDVCTLDLGHFLGHVLKPEIKGICYGEKIAMGNHVGDWEHVSIQFKGRVPLNMYVSSHNFGAFYKYSPHYKHFTHESHDTRKGLSMSPVFPFLIRLEKNHPILYSALGSHGLWGSAGVQQYNSLPKLEDHTGKGTEWHTWRNLEVIDLEDPLALAQPHRLWLTYEGHWGNPKAQCHPLMAGFCELNEGPTGIPRKRVNFPC